MMSNKNLQPHKKIQCYPTADGCCMYVYIYVTAVVVEITLFFLCGRRRRCLLIFYLRTGTGEAAGRPPDNRKQCYQHPPSGYYTITLYKYKVARGGRTARWQHTAVFVCSFFPSRRCWVFIWEQSLLSCLLEIIHLKPAVNNAYALSGWGNHFVDNTVFCFAAAGRSLFLSNKNPLVREWKKKRLSTKGRKEERKQTTFNRANDVKMSKNFVI